MMRGFLGEGEGVGEKEGEREKEGEWKDARLGQLDAGVPAE